MAEKKKVIYIGKIWKYGKDIVISIPKSQQELLKPFRNKKLKITVEEV